jgi:hypothetical protein
VIVLVAKSADSKVPVHDPERSANGPTGAVGEDVPGAGLGVDAHALVTHARTIAPTRTMRIGTTDQEYKRPTFVP